MPHPKALLDHDAHFNYETLSFLEDRDWVIVSTVLISKMFLELNVPIKFPDN